MAVLLLGKSLEGKEWQILHRTESYEEMTYWLKVYCDRTKYKAFSVVSEKYFEASTGSILNESEAFKETPIFVESAFCDLLGGAR